MDIFAPTKLARHLQVGDQFYKFSPSGSTFTVATVRHIRVYANSVGIAVTLESRPEEDQYLYRLDLNTLVIAR